MKREQRERLMVMAAFAATVVLSLRMFFTIGFTTSDDLQYYLTARTPWANWMSDARIYAHGAGRFYFLITKVFYYVPYLIDSFVWTKAVQYVTLVACLGMFAYTVGRMLHSKGIGALTFLLLVWNLQVTPNMHVPTIAYPFYFTASSMLFMLGLLVYLRYTERGGYWRVLASSALMLACFLFYETYLIFAMLFGVAILARHRFRLGSRDLWREALPLASAAVLYVCCYWGYRQYLLATVPDLTFYDGSSFDAQKVSLRGFVNIVLRCTRGAMPMQNFSGNKGLIANNSMVTSGARSALPWVWMHASAAVWITAVLQTALLWWITRRAWFKRLRWSQIGWGMAVAIVAAFASHTLIGVATKYNVEWSGYISGYVTTFYSFLFVAMALALLITASLKICGSPKASRVVRAIWCVLLLFTSVVIGYANEHIAREWHKDGLREALVDEVARTGYFDSLPPDAIVNTVEMHFTPGIAFVCSYDANDIENYILHRAGRRIALAGDTARLERKRGQSPDAPVYYMHVQCPPQGDGIMMAMCRMDSACLSATAADVFYLSPAKRCTVLYNTANGWQAQTIMAGRRQRVVQCHIEAEGIDPRSIIVSNMVSGQ